jgi:hypothetical protein
MLNTLLNTLMKKQRMRNTLMREKEEESEWRESSRNWTRILGNTSSSTETKLDILKLRLIKTLSFLK